MALVPAARREHDEIRAVFDVADEDALLLPGLEVRRPARWLDVVKR